RQAEGEVEHVLLVLGRLLEEVVPLGVDDHVTGRAGERALAGTLEVDAVAMRDLQHREPQRRVHLAASTVLLDEHHLRHHACPITDWAGIASSAATAAPSTAASSDAAPIAIAAAARRSITRSTERPAFTAAASSPARSMLS